jgi:uncharacterized protein YodC (DUF2158 family)
MANKSEFVIGDIVKLKSGGPDMTIRSVPDSMDSYYNCQWFAGKKLEHGRFPADSIEKVKKENGTN